jgi:hypothetical protein
MNSKLLQYNGACYAPVWPKLTQSLWRLLQRLVRLLAWNLQVGELYGHSFDKCRGDLQRLQL